MAIDYQRLLDWQVPDIEQDYSARDCMLYALGVGFGSDPLDAGQLRYVYGTTCAWCRACLWCSATPASG